MIKIKLSYFRYVACIVFVCTGFQSIHAQHVFPNDGATLNYTQIMFEVPFVSSATQYRYYVSVCNERGENCTVLKSYTSTVRAIRLDEPFVFGATYRWNYEAWRGKTKIYTSPSYLFFTSKSPLVDSTYQRFEYTIPNKNRKNGVLFIDGLKTAVLMSGKPVYYLSYKSDHTMRDINLTNQGTITFIDNRMGEVKEVRLNGEMIWIGPVSRSDDNKRSERFHHEMEKLKNGNYLAAGKKKASEYGPEADLGVISGELLSETIIEFDAERNEVWRFDLLPELKRQYNIQVPMNNFNPTRLGHLNGMVVDEKNNWVYASFKTFNTVMKIDKQTNNILYTYGSKTINFKDSTMPGLSFEQQHCPVFHENGNLLIFNNGNPDSGSGIVELKTGSQVDSSNEVVHSLFFKPYLKQGYYNPQMGSVQYLGNNRVLVGMGTLPHLFEINYKTGKIYWQAYTYMNKDYYASGRKWIPQQSYRVFYYSSLYPYYAIADAWKTKKGITIQISNVGSETDTYTITDTAKPDTPPIRIRLKPNQSKQIQLPQGNGQIEYTILSEKSGKKIVVVAPQ